MADPVKRAAVITHGAERPPTRHSRGSKPWRRSPASSSSCRRRAGEARVDSPKPSRPRPTSSSCSAETGRCCARSGGCSAPPSRPSASISGSVGFLTTIPEEELERGVKRVFAGDYERGRPPDARGARGGSRRDAVNDIVATSSTLGRMIELSWTVGGEDLGTLRCDGLIVATPSGSTAYNLSNGGPVLVWGLDALAVTFVAPHSLQARPLVIPRGSDVVVRNLDAGCLGDLARGRSRLLRGRARRDDDDPARAAANTARDAARGDVLQPLPAHIRRLIECKTGACSDGCASRTSSSSARRSSPSRPV